MFSSIPGYAYNPRTCTGDRKLPVSQNRTWIISFHMVRGLVKMDGIQFLMQLPEQIETRSETDFISSDKYWKKQCLPQL